MGEDMQDCMQTGDILYGRPPGCPEHISLLLNREQRFYFTITSESLPPSSVSLQSSSSSAGAVSCGAMFSEPPRNVKLVGPLNVCFVVLACMTVSLSL